MAVFIAVVIAYVYIFWLSQTWPVTLKILEKVSSDCSVLTDRKKTILGIKCVATVISGGVDITDVPGLHFLRRIHFHWELAKLVQRFVFPEITAYLSDFYLFITQ